MSYSLSSNFVPVEWYLAELWPLNLYFCSNLKLSGLFLTSFDILTWYLVSGYIGMSYSVRSNFVPVEWLLAELWPSNLYILFKFEVVRTFLWRPLIYWLVIWYVAISRWVTVKFEFCSGRMIFGWVMNLELVFFVQILSCPGLFWRPLRYWLVIWYVAISRWVTVEFRISFRSNDI